MMKKLLILLLLLPCIINAQVSLSNGVAASTSTKGFLTSTDWNTFNGKANTASPTFTGTVVLPTTTLGGTMSGASGTISISGNISGNNFLAAGLVRAAAGSTIEWSGRSKGASSADGLVEYTANSGTTNTARLAVGGLKLSYLAKTANYTVTAADYYINCTANSFTVTLPTAASVSGQTYVIKNTASGTTITVGTTSSQTIDGSTTYSLAAQYKYVAVTSDGANWIITANN